jgi:co-chaperonin GroES (HSP10)
MIRPLRDRLVVRPLENPLSSVIQIIEHTDPGKHRRGEVLAIGPEVAWGTNVGDVIHFTDLFKFPVIEQDGERLLILQEADVCFIEEREAA